MATAPTPRLVCDTIERNDPPVNNMPASVPDGFEDWNNAIGTGPFMLKSSEPGVRVTFERNPHYFREGRPYLDAVEILAVNDGTARLSALQSGSVDVVNRVETRIASRLKQSPGIDVIVSPSRTHYCFVMDTRVAPFSDPKVRLALKYAIDRKAILNNVLAGYGSIGNDQSIPEGDPFYAALEQHEYDPEKARALLKEAGHENLQIELSAADPYKALMEGVKTSAYLGEEVLDGARTHQARRRRIEISHTGGQQKARSDDRAFEIPFGEKKLTPPRPQPSCRRRSRRFRRPRPRSRHPLRLQPRS